MPTPTERSAIDTTILRACRAVSGRQAPPTNIGAMPKVRDALQLLKAHGWVVKRTRGSHRQLEHPTRRGNVTIAGHPRDDLPAGTWRSILRQAGLTDRRLD